MAKVAIASFIRRWLDLGGIGWFFKDPVRFSQWSRELGQAIQQEVEAFTPHVILNAEGTLNDLFASSTVFVNQNLAPFYELTGVAGAEIRERPYTGGTRAGLLTMFAVLASAADASVPNPFRLGETLLAKVFCQELQPPRNLPEFLKPELAKEGSEGEYFEKLTSSPVCVTCRLNLNPLGFGLGDFDAIGAMRCVHERGHAIDSSGIIPTGEAFVGPVELAGAVANNPEARSCSTHQLFCFATGNQEKETDYASLEAACRDFESRQFFMKELLVALTTTRSFMYRALETGESFE